MNTILIVSAVIFSFSTGYFFLNRKKFESDFPWLVSFITVISYVVMIMNLNLYADPVAMLWTRWAGYALSCTILTASLVGIFNIVGKKRVVALVLTPLIMLTGVLAAVATNTTFIVMFFVLGMIPFISLISIFQSKTTSKNRYVLSYLYYGWMAFPVIFILSPETFSIIPSLSIILIGYLIADFFTKIVFYFHIKRLSSPQE